MNETQLRAVTAGFLHVATTSPEVFKEWQETEKEPVAMGALIQKTLNLKTTPTPEHIQTMSNYADAHLQPHVAALKEKHGQAPSLVAAVFGMTQK